MPDVVVKPFRLGLTRWSRLHAAAILCACAAGALTSTPWPVAAAALASFSAWVLLSREPFTPAGTFGAANGVTAARLALTLGLALGAPALEGFEIGLALGVVWLLDGLDGWLARRTGQASPFGALFDMEVDALLVLVAELELWRRGTAGLWILSTGVLRYAYVLALAVAPSRAGEMPRSNLARIAFGLLLAGLLAAFLWPRGGLVAAGIGTVAVITSFARGFHWSYLRSGRAGAPSAPAPTPRSE